jgi:hypothetical protein
MGVACLQSCLDLGVMAKRARDETRILRSEVEGIFTPDDQPFASRQPYFGGYFVDESASAALDSAM